MLHGLIFSAYSHLKLTLIQHEHTLKKSLHMSSGLSQVIELFSHAEAMWKWMLRWLTDYSASCRAGMAAMAELAGCNDSVGLLH